MRSLDDLCGEDRAVSPVIGTAILVGIAVILATVVGAFALGEAPNEQSSPQSVFAFEQSTRNYSADTSGVTNRRDRADELLAITALHRSGESVKADTITVRVTATNSSLNIVNNESVYDIVYVGDGALDEWQSTPNGSANAEIKSGESFRMLFYGPPEEQIEGNRLTDYDPTSPATDARGGATEFEIGVGEQVTDDFPQGQEFRPGDEIEIVWSPIGGDSSHVLDSYTVAEK